MSQEPEKGKKRGRFWLSVGEAAGVIAVIIAGLNYWDSHREHVAEASREAAVAQKTGALVLVAAPRDGGRRLDLKAADPGQVIESQAYVFPQSVLAQPMDVAARAPAIDVGWLAAGLARALDARKAGGEGHGRLPVAVTTSYLVGGEARQDRALYLVGYGWKRRLLGGPAVRLEGIAFVRRLTGDSQAAVDHAWNS